MHDNNSSIRSNTQTKLGQDSEPYISFLDLTISEKDSVSEEELSCFLWFCPWCDNISSRKDSCCIAGDPAADSNHDGHIYPDAVMKARDSSHTLCEDNASTSSVPTLGQSNNPNYVEPPSIPSLLEKAQTLIVQCDYDLAQRFALRILEREPSNVDGKEILGVTQLETGDIDSAKQVSSINCAELDLVLQLSPPPQSSVDILNPYSSTSRWRKLRA